MEGIYSEFLTPRRGVTKDGRYFANSGYYFLGINKFTITIYFDLHFTYNGTKSCKP